MVKHLQINLSEKFRSILIAKKNLLFVNINELLKSKACTFKDVPVKIMVNSVHIYSYALTKIFNNCGKRRNFPDILKYTDITPVFEKDDASSALSQNI